MSPEDPPIELLSTAQMAEADRLTIASGVPGLELMEAAGRAVADGALRMLAEQGEVHGSVLILCGPGNNGGDGFVAARLLREQGVAVIVGLLYDRAGLKGDALLAAQAWTGRVQSAALVSYEGVSLVIDALFGAGLTRDIDGRARVVIERLNAWRAAGGRVLAVDTPSGVDGDTGAVRGVAVEADAAVTFFRLKPGHLLHPGRALCGRIELAQIGIADDALTAIAPQTFLNAPALWRGALPSPSVTGHKYDRGHVLVLSGPMHRTGAARLAARGALRGGAGLVTIASPREALAVNAAHLTAVMLAPVDGAAEYRALVADHRLNALVLGPGAGVGAPLRALVREALAAPGRRGVVLDADALTSFSGRWSELAAWIARSEASVVLTPHDGEFASLFKAQAEGVESSNQQPDVLIPETDRLGRARIAAKLMGATVLLKGADTVVAHPDGRASIACDLPPWLATAGSGDVLAGIIAAHLARGAPAFEAASAAVWLHGAAARAFGPGLIARDLPEALPGVLKVLGGG